MTETTESPTRTRTNLRLKSPLHIAFASAARERGVSFNNLAEDVLEDFVVRISECLALIPREDMTVSLEAQLKGELEGAARAYGVSLNRLIEEVCQSWVMTVYRVSDEPQHQPQPS